MAPECALCGQSADFASDTLGPVLGPVHDNRSGEKHYVHRLCALWSPEVYQTDKGKLCRVLESIRRGRGIRCSFCSQRGATIGCRVDRCLHSYHLACAGESKCLFNVHKFVLACPSHAKHFKQESKRKREARAAEAPRNAEDLDAPQEAESPQQQVVVGAEEIAAARGAAKRARHENRPRAVESSDDEEHFFHKEQRRLARDRAKLAPLILGGDRGGLRDSAGASAASCNHEGWEAVGGLPEVVTQLKEMVLLPLVYPAIFKEMGVDPPRGILFHGEPGTGKTLVARALAGACARISPTPVAFFARKGADCLGKFSGEAERTLRLLFEEAARLAPSIIFLDELDGLLPARATREGSSDQIYASVVATLLSLLDGVADRGNVVIIGATNRPDTIDPALRRPGRFDREVYFGLPSQAGRAAILDVHTAKWPCRPSQEVIQEVAAAADGYAGADLQALCSAAVMSALGRLAPQLLDGHPSELSLGAAQDHSSKASLLHHVQVEASDWRLALRQAPAPCSKRQGLAALSADRGRALPYELFPLLRSGLHAALHLLRSSSFVLARLGNAAASAAAAFPCTSTEFEGCLQSMGIVSKAPAPGRREGSVSAEPQDSAGGGACHNMCRLVLAGEGEVGQELVAQALLRLLDGCQVHTLSLPTLMVAGHGNVSQGAVSLVQEAARRAVPGKPSVLFLPSLEGWALGSKSVSDSETEESGFHTPGSPPAFPVSAAKKRLSPSKFFAVNASPFRGLTSLEDRAYASPAGLRAAAATAGYATPPAGPRQAHGSSSAPLQSTECRNTAGCEHAEDGSAATPVRARSAPVLSSEAWRVFLQLMNELPIAGPTVVLGTCHSRMQNMPAELSAFFSRSSPGSGGKCMALQLDAAGPRDVREAVQRAAQVATRSIVAQGIEFTRACSTSKPGNQHEPAHPREACDQPQAGESPEALQPSRLSEEGARLYVKVARAIEQYGARLAGDPRTLLVADTDSPALASSILQPASATSLHSVALQARAGLLPVREDFLTAAAAAISAAQTAARDLHGYSARAAAASALSDEIWAWDRALAATLRLSDPAARTALLRAESAIAEHLSVVCTEPLRAGEGKGQSDCSAAGMNPSEATAADGLQDAQQLGSRPADVGQVLSDAPSRRGSVGEPAHVRELHPGISEIQTRLEVALEQFFNAEASQGGTTSAHLTAKRLEELVAEATAQILGQVCRSATELQERQDALPAWVGLDTVARELRDAVQCWLRR